MGDILNFKLGIDSFRTAHHNQNVELNGIIKTANNVTPELVSATFKCLNCGTIITQPQGGGRCKLLRPEKCTNINCNLKRPKFEFLQNESVFRDYQTIWLKPLVEPKLHIGRGQKVILKNDLVGAQEGETVTVRGRLGFELKGRTNFAIPVVFALDITTLK